MNCTVYLFGEFGLGYTQYPQDGAEDIFRHGAALAETQTQIAIHRDGNRMYYAYLRKLDEGEGHYLGMGLMVEGYMFRDVNPLFDIFGTQFENIVIADRLLSLNSRGHVVANVGLLIEKRTEAERVTTNLCNTFARLTTQLIPLPQALFDHISTQVWKFGEDAAPSDIRKASEMSGYTLVQKGVFQFTPKATADGAQPNAEQPKTNPVDQKSSFKEQHSGPTEQKTNTAEQKTLPAVHKTKRWDGVKTLLLTLLLLVSAGLGYTAWQLYSSNLAGTSAMSSYNRVKMTNAELMNKMNLLEQQLDEAQLKNLELEKSMRSQDTIISALRDYYHCSQPIVATSLYLTREGQDGYASATVGHRVKRSANLLLQPHIRYIGLENSTAKLTLRWYSPRTFDFFDFGDFTFGSKSHENVRVFDIQRGEHQLDFDVWAGEQHRWEPGKYRVEVWADGECLQRKEFWID